MSNQRYLSENISEVDVPFYNFIDQTLWNDWDPIGVNEYAEDARDEYYSYLPEIYRMVVNGKSLLDIANYLFKTESETMGLPLASYERCTSIAEKILKGKAVFD